MENTVEELYLSVEKAKEVLSKHCNVNDFKNWDKSETFTVKKNGILILIVHII
ncbi:MAG: hypothetical protein H7X88_01725 [Gloeobacteraceae cyanobacterium ES-bin-316]|nr:hypothetical protein [Ferruginibacter sp.]